MKYYKKDLWLADNIQELTKGEEAELLWKNNDLAYNEYFGTIKERLPKTFLNIFYKEHRFHDYVIKEITYIITDKNKYNVAMIISYGEKSYKLEFLDVKFYTVNIVDRKFCICGKLGWGFCEFELLPEKDFKINILCDIVNEIEIIFEKIRVRLLKQ